MKDWLQAQLKSFSCDTLDNSSAQSVFVWSPEPIIPSTAICHRP